MAVEMRTAFDPPGFQGHLEVTLKAWMAQQPCQDFRRKSWHVG
jgi:hypothetical protein